MVLLGVKENNALQGNRNGDMSFYSLIFCSASTSKKLRTSSIAKH